MAMITFNPRWHNKRAMAVSPAEADKIQSQLLDMDNLGQLSEERLDFLRCVEHVYLNNYRPAPQKPATEPENGSQYVDTSHLTHAGIEQGMNQALPTGDRD